MNIHALNVQIQEHRSAKTVGILLMQAVRSQDRLGFAEVRRRNDCQTGLPRLLHR